MKNSSAYSGDAFAFFKKVCQKKRSLELKNRLLTLDSSIIELFDQYEQCFADNTVELLTAHGYNDPPKADLTELYNYDSQTLSRLKTLLTTSPEGRIVKCQNCTINDVNTFDHLVPQGEFPEFIVHPKNLFCSCGDCNSRKSSIWRNADRRTTLNLYLDQLPNIQYLFARTEVSNTNIEVAFTLQNVNGVDNNLFSLIKEHYTRLDLFRRFEDGADSIITSFKTTLVPLKLLNDPTLARNIAFESIRLERLAFGFNYWQSVLKHELLTNDDFMIDYE
jgi:hypothetical protein